MLYSALLPAACKNRAASSAAVSTETKTNSSKQSMHHKQCMCSCPQPATDGGRAEGEEQVGEPVQR